MPSRPAETMGAAHSLYVAGYALERSMVLQRQQDHDAAWVLSQDELTRRFDALPETAFPNTRRYASALTSGAGHERFEFTLGLLIDISPTRCHPPDHGPTRALLEFFRYPAEHWHPTDDEPESNSTFATVRLPTKRAAGIARAYKLIEAARDRWRAINAPHRDSPRLRAPQTELHRN